MSQTGSENQPVVVFLGVLGIWLFVAYGVANGLFALKSPEGWLRARWTARRGIDPDSDPPPSTGYIRGLGVTYLFIAGVAIYIAIEVTASSLTNLLGR
jgi:hypothetical protein